MTIKWSEQFKPDNKELPTLLETIEKSLVESKLSKEEIKSLHKNISELILETVPEIVWVDHSDSFLFEGGFEESSKQLLINLSKIGISTNTNL
ncbi:MAG: hypothetical protein WCT07_00925 [Candidatus Paceibacterota bacterium]|jgi:hypothetical protein